MRPGFYTVRCRSAPFSDFFNKSLVFETGVKTAVAKVKARRKFGQPDLGQDGTIDYVDGAVQFGGEHIYACIFIYIYI